MRSLLFLSARSVNTERRERWRLSVRPHVSIRNTDGHIWTKFDIGSLTENYSAICVFINVNEQENIILNVTSRYQEGTRIDLRTGYGLHNFMSRDQEGTGVYLRTEYGLHNLMSRDQEGTREDLRTGYGLHNLMSRNQEGTREVLRTGYGLHN